MSEHKPRAGQPDSTHRQADPHDRPPGHERRIDRDINLRNVGLTVGGLMAGTVVAMVLMWWMHQVLLGSSVAHDPQPPALPEARETVMPPGPLLQASPEREMEQFLAEEAERLASYGWKDEAAGVVHIPVDRAMEVLVEQGRTAQSMLPDPSAGDGNQPEAPAAVEAAAAAGGATTTTVPAQPAGGPGPGVLSAPDPAGSGEAAGGADGTDSEETGAPGQGGAGGASASDGRE